MATFNKRKQQDMEDLFPDKNLGTNWKFLNETLLTLYENLLRDHDQLIRAISRGAGINPKIAYAELVASLNTFYISNQDSIQPYLAEKYTPFTPDDYENIIFTCDVRKSKHDYHKLIKMSMFICKWATTWGMFNTKTETDEPKDFYQVLQEQA